MTFIFKYRPLGILKIFHIQTFLTHNYSIRNASVLDAATPPTSEASSGKQKHIKVEKDVESGLESDDEESIREKALLVCYISCSKLLTVYRCQAEAERYQAEVEKIRKGRSLKDNELERPKKKLKMEDKPFFIPGKIIDLT